MTHIPENLSSMTQRQAKEWLKREVPIDEAYKIITGVDPCKGLRSGTHEFNTHSIFGKILIG